MILCQLSGGFDSVAVFCKLIEKGEDVIGVFFDLGQPYLEQEKKAVEYVIDHFRNHENFKGITTKKIDINLGGTTENKDYIPVRNLVLGAISANIAISYDINYIAVGNKTLEVREDDPWSFSDCSVEFYKQLSELTSFASENKEIKFLMPLIESGVPLTKTEVLKIILKSGLDLDKLWSCYENNTKPCGKCFHCQELHAARAGL